MMVDDRWTVKDFWGERDIRLGIGRQDKELFAVGIVIDRNTEQWVHIKKSDLLDFLKRVGWV